MPRKIDEAVNNLIVNCTTPSSKINCFQGFNWEKHLVSEKMKEKLNRQLWFHKSFMHAKLRDANLW